MLEWYADFKKFSVKYKLVACKSREYLRHKKCDENSLNDDYNKWESTVRVDLKRKNDSDVDKLRKGMKFAYDGHKARYEFTLSNKQAFYTIGFTVLITILVTFGITLINNPSTFEKLLIIVGGAVIIAGIFWFKLFYSNLDEDYNLALYYSAVLDIIDRLEDTDVAENTATVVNPSSIKGTTKNKRKKKRKGIRK